MVRTFIVHRLKSTPWVVDGVKAFIGSEWLARRRWYRAFVLATARRFARRKAGVIPGVAVETTVECGARCIMCAHGHRDLHGTMAMDLFKKIIDDCAAEGIDSVTLTGYGEPLMDPFLTERIAYLRGRGMTYGMVTNGHYLDEARARTLLELGGLVFITFSVCGYRREVYEAVMPGLRRDRTYANIAGFLRLKRASGCRRMQTVISTVKLSENEADRPAFLRYWRAQEGGSQVITAELWQRGLPPGMAVRGRMHVPRSWLPPCRWLWGMLYVYYDGRVAPCCDDGADRALIIGDLRTQTLREVAQGQALAQLRGVHLADGRMSHGVCGKCYHNCLWPKEI